MSTEENKGTLSPFVKHELCSCGRKTYGVATVRYPTGFKVEFAICEECSRLAESVMLKKTHERKLFGALNSVMRKKSPDLYDKRDESSNE